MDTDRAYLLGLIVGGGGFNADCSVLTIRFPFNSWGDVGRNPERAGEIANDILKVVGPKMCTAYGLHTTYRSGKRSWNVECHGDMKSLLADLNRLQIEPKSRISTEVDIGILVEQLGDDEQKRHFVAGLADTIGSLAPSHRRFSDDVQIISFEIPGFSLRFVCQVCQLLHSIRCNPDQVLWQHPNMQSGKDAFYTGWKKGNKIRIKLDTYLKEGRMFFRSKAVAAKNNLIREPASTYAVPCQDAEVVISGTTAVHVDENYSKLPADIRGCHFMHHKQLCAALKCPNVSRDKVLSALKSPEEHLSPFTVLTKQSLGEIQRIVEQDELLHSRQYTEIDAKVVDLIEATGMMFPVDGGFNFSSEQNWGYPVTQIHDAINYLLQASNGVISGKSRRTKGGREKYLAKIARENPNCTIHIRMPDILTPLILSKGDYGALVGPVNPAVYRKLITFDSEEPCKMYIRKIRLEDFK